MKPQNELENPVITVLLLGLFAAVLLVNLYSIEALSSTYNDNTTVITRLNVSNVAPRVEQMVFYKQGTPSSNNIVLEEGTTINVRCNATVNDTNGVADISTVNATIYRSSVTDSEDNNDHYTNASCTQVSQLDTLAAYYSCNFVVWYYADNGTWTCNMSALDTGGLSNSSETSKVIDALYAINLSNSTIHFGELNPNQISASDVVLNVTNTGNINLTIALRAYAKTAGDLWAMNCTVGNISRSYERYSINSGQAWTGMTAVPSSFSDIVGLTVPQRIDDSDAQKVNSTNSTYWKIKAPLGTRGVCNGTVELSAKA